MTDQKKTTQQSKQTTTRKKREPENPYTDYSYKKQIGRNTMEFASDREYYEWLAAQNDEED